MNALKSPSIQIWIPLREEGNPVIEGIYEQVLSTDRGVFAGPVGRDD